MHDDRLPATTDSAGAVDTDAEETPEERAQKLFDTLVRFTSRRLPGASDAEVRRLASMELCRRERVFSGALAEAEADRIRALAEADRILEEIAQLETDIQGRTASPRPRRLESRVRPTGQLFTREELLAAKARRIEEINDPRRFFELGIVLGSEPVVAGQEQLHSAYWKITQRLLEDAELYLNLRLIYWALDKDALLPVGARWRADAGIEGPLRDLPDARSLISSLCGEGFSLDTAIQAEGNDWAGLSPIQRAWRVHTLALDLAETAPEHLGSGWFDDLTAAADGDVAAWARLRAACLTDDKAQSAEPAARPGRSASITPDSSRRSAPRRTPGRAGRPPGDGLFRSDEEAREILTAGVRACIADNGSATKSDVIRWLEDDHEAHRARGDVTRAAVDYWVKKRLGYPDWPTFRDSVQ